MKLTKLTETERNVVETNNGLRLYLQSLLKGKPATPRSWLYEDQTPDEVLDNWLRILSVLNEGSTVDKKVFRFDTAQLSKWGPQGEVLPISDLMRDIVLPTFNDTNTPRAFSSPEWRDALRMTRRDLDSIQVYGLRPASYDRVVDDMRARDTLESNSGWPDFTKRSRPIVTRQAIKDACDGKWLNYPAIALFRNYNLKTRLVWMFPMSTNLVEGSYFQVLQSRIMNATVSERPSRRADEVRDFFAPWRGFEDVRRVVSDAYNTCPRLDKFYFCASDFSNTDASFSFEHSLQVYKVLRSAFQDGDASLGLLNSLEHMHTIPLVVGPDLKITGQHGVSSGSNWTNFIETIFDKIFGHYVEIKSENVFGYKLMLHPCMAIGDDMLWYSLGYNPHAAEFLEECAADCGLVVNSEKVTNDRSSVKYLQRLFIRGYNRPDGLCRGVYPTVRALKSSIYPERFHRSRDWSKDMFAARQFMILENCVDHPLFTEFVKFICDGHEYLRVFARMSSAKLDKVSRESKHLPGLNPTYNQERRDSSLSQFESIRVAREL